MEALIADWTTNLSRFLKKSACFGLLREIFYHRSAHSKRFIFLILVPIRDIICNWLKLKAADGEWQMYLRVPPTTIWNPLRTVDFWTHQQLLWIHNRAQAKAGQTRQSVTAITAGRATESIVEWLISFTNTSTQNGMHPRLRWWRWWWYGDDNQSTSLYAMYDDGAPSKKSRKNDSFCGISFVGQQK